VPRPLNEQVIVIAAASSGIGHETALLLAGRGARVVVSARSDEALDDLVGEIESVGGQTLSIPADVSIFSAVENLAERAREACDRIDTWVNNAGVLIAYSALAMRLASKLTVNTLSGTWKPLEYRLG
jgi:short-subunit dehydrogenase